MKVLIGCYKHSICECFKNGTYDGTKYNISNFTFGPNNTQLHEYINNDAIPPIIKEENKQQILQLLRTANPVAEVNNEEKTNNESSNFEDIINSSKNTILLNEKEETVIDIDKKKLDQLPDNNNNEWKVVQVNGDGNCFFYSFIKSILSLDRLKDEIITANGIRKYLSELTETQVKNIGVDLEFFVGTDTDNNPNNMKYNNFDEFKKELIYQSTIKYVDGNVINLIGKLFDILFIIYDEPNIKPFYYGKFPAKYYIFLNRINNNHYNLLQYNGKRIFTIDDSNVITEELKKQAQNDFNISGGRRQIKKKTRKNKYKRRKTSKKTH